MVWLCRTSGSAEGQFVGAFQGRATDPADDRRTVAADQWVNHDAGAGGAPELGGVRFGLADGDRLSVGRHPRKA